MPFSHARIALIAVAAATSPAFAASTTWTGGTGAWWTAANWSNGLPDNTTDVRIDNNTALNSAVTLVSSAVDNSLILDMGDKLILGSPASTGTVALANFSVGNAGNITTGTTINAAIFASGIFVNNGVIDATNGSTLYLDGQAIVNNGMLKADLPSGATPARIVLNHNSTPGGMSFSGSGNISISDTAVLLIENPITFNTSGWFNLDGQMQIHTSSALSLGALHGSSDSSIVSTSPSISTLTVTNGSASLAYSGTISGNLSLVKTGVNSLILANDNAYIGTTDVYGGSLQLDNPTLSAGGAGLGTLTVHTGAILAGEGSATCITNIQSGGILSPGDMGAGTFTAANSLHLLANSTLLLDIADDPLSRDLLNITGGQFTADTVNVQFSTHGPITPGTTCTLLNWTGATPAGTPITASTFHLVNGSAHGFFSVNPAADTASFTETVPGDTNQDGHVDLTDFSTLLNNFGKSTSLWTDGNFDGQPTIDLTDLSDLLNNFGATITPTFASPRSTSLAAPEPATLLVVAPLLPLFSRRRSRRA